MPIYEYSCAKCGAETEAFQKVSDPAPESCPSCGSLQSLSKLVSRSSFHLKGGGWYSDLYSSVPKDGSTPKGSAPSEAPKAEPAPSASPKKEAGGTAS